MRTRTSLVASPASGRLWRRPRPDRTELWTEAVGLPPPVYGERWERIDGRWFRLFEPGRSKLASALAGGWKAPLPRAGERWLYLGAATGTTASHVADLLGPSGALYAVERSVRPFARLLHLAERWPNLIPILADAREPDRYADRVPFVDGIYADIAQPDQVAIVRANLEVYLRDGPAAVLLALKTSSLGRGVPAGHRAREAESALGESLTLEPALRLAPAYRSHFLLGGRRRTEDAGGSRREPARRGPSGSGRYPRHRLRRPISDS